MAPRAHWKGYLKLSLVSCPVALYPAIAAAERISFRQVNRQTGNRLRQQLVDTITGEVVQSHDKGRGYEVGQDQFVVVPDEELQAARAEARTRPYSATPPSSALAPPRTKEAPAREALLRREEVKAGKAKPEETRRQKPRAEEPPPVVEPAPAPPPVVNDRTIAMDRFVRRADIDARYLDTPYYIAPREEMGQEAFAVIREAMRRKQMVGMGRVVLGRRERPIIVEPIGDGLLGFTLRYAHEVRGPAECFAEIPKLTLPDEMLEVAERIIEMKTGEFDPAFLEDRYRTVLASMLKEKQVDLTAKAEAPAPSRQNVIDLMAALKQSLSKERTSAPTAAPRRAAAAAAKVSPAKRSKGRSRKSG